MGGRWVRVKVFLRYSLLITKEKGKSNVQADNRIQKQSIKLKIEDILEPWRCSVDFLLTSQYFSITSDCGAGMI